MSAAPNLLADVWMARLHGAYPGGGYLSFADDGTHAWAAYRFSTGAALMLRDGVPQGLDAPSVRLALQVMIGQRPDPTFLLLVSPTEPGPAFGAEAFGAAAAVESGSGAESAALKALGGPGDWMTALRPPPAGVKPNAALLFMPRPAGAGLSSAGARALRALKSRLADGAAAAVFLPAGTPLSAVDAVASAAAAAFGASRVADLPRGTLVVAAAGEVETDPLVQFSRQRTGTTPVDPESIQKLTVDVRWRSAPPSK
jgi:hypothetical protein